MYAILVYYELNSNYVCGYACRYNVYFVFGYCLIDMPLVLVGYCKV
jgi:hypothetical protein